VDEFGGVSGSKTFTATFRLEGLLQEKPVAQHVSGPAKSLARFNIKANENVYEITARLGVAERVASMWVGTHVAVRGNLVTHKWQTAGFTNRTLVELQATAIYEIENG
jgi:hypothetical protein